MEPAVTRKHLAWIATMWAVAVISAGCRPDVPPESEPASPPPSEAAVSVEPEPAEPEPIVESPPQVEPETPDEEPTPDEAPTPAEAQPEPFDDDLPTEGPIDLGPPLVEDPDALDRLNPDKPIWLDKQGKALVMIGQICQREAPLELFACLRNTKEHEAVVSIDVHAAWAHAALVALGAKVGSPARWDPEYVPAAGTEIEITVIWLDEQGERQTARAQDWVLDTQTGEPMTQRWVFAGSVFWKDEQTGREYYQAEGGDFICVANFTTAMLDLPIESTQANSGLMFQAFTERIPPLGTPVTLLLKPKLDE